MSAPTTSMDTGTSASGNKRPRVQLVDPDDNAHISSSKKARIAPDENKKIKCLKFLLLSYEYLITIVFPHNLEEAIKNITIGNQIMSVLFTCFNYWRQRGNNTVGSAGEKAKNKTQFTITSLGTEYYIKFEDAIAAVRNAADHQGLVFKRFGNDDPENWYGTAAPYADFFTANALRYNELRLGHSVMPIKKIGDITEQFPVDKYGLNGSHHVLLEGCTFPPEKRGSMAQSLGPMTTMLCHIRTEEKYRRKWTNAAKKAMSHVPCIDEILDAVKDKKAPEVRGLLSILADILLITTARQTHRMFFPINMLYTVYSMDVDDSDHILIEGRPTEYFGRDTLLRHFNVSGTGGFYTYNLASMFKFTMEGRFTKEEASQVLFHTIFGTYKEDLSILSEITRVGTWFTREELGPKFKRSGAPPSITEFDPVKMKFYAKLSSANQTGLLSATYNQISSMPVFSGRRTQKFDDNFFEVLSNKLQVSTVSKSIPQLMSTLSGVMAELREEMIKRGRELQIGTVEWKKVEGMDLINGGAPVNLNLIGTGHFFLGKKQRK